MTLNCAADSTVMFSSKKVKRFCTLRAKFDIFIIHPMNNFLFMFSSFAGFNGQL